MRRKQEPHGAHFRSGDPRKFAKQTEYDSKTKVYSRNIPFDKFIKSVVRLLGEY